MRPAARATFRTVIASRVHGSVEYSRRERARSRPARDVGYLLLVAPSRRPLNAERIHDVATSDRDRSSRNRHPGAGPVPRRQRVRACRPERPMPTVRGIDSRFDVQVRQSLPFMNFSSARWEMLLAVRNFFREAGPSSRSTTSCSSSGRQSASSAA